MGSFQITLYANQTSGDNGTGGGGDGTGDVSAPSLTLPYANITFDS